MENTNEVIEEVKIEEKSVEPEKKGKLAELKETLHEALESDSGSGENDVIFKVIGVAAGIIVIAVYEGGKWVYKKYHIGDKIASIFNKEARAARKQARKDKKEAKKAPAQNTNDEPDDSDSNEDDSEDNDA